MEAERPEGNDEADLEAMLTQIEYPISQVEMTMEASFAMLSHQSIVLGLFSQYISNCQELRQKVDPNMEQLRDITLMFLRGFHMQKHAYQELLRTAMLWGSAAENNMNTYAQLADAERQQQEGLGDK